MKEEGRTANELVERYGFVLTESFSKVCSVFGNGMSFNRSSCNDAQVNSLCESGLSAETQVKQIVLGDPTYGVYLCKHADVVSQGQVGVGKEFYLVVFKYTKV